MSGGPPVGRVTLPTSADTADLGRRLAALLRAGDLVVLAGALGAGKTTLTQGIGAGLRVRGDVTSPTFVIARVHRSEVGGPDLVHVDAYRLGSLDEVDDLDLDASLPESVTVVEWGEGRVDGLAEDRLVVELARTEGIGPDVTEQRTLTITAVGERWAGPAAVALATVLSGAPEPSATP